MDAGPRFGPRLKTSLRYVSCSGAAIRCLRALSFAVSRNVAVRSKMSAFDRSAGLPAGHPDAQACALRAPVPARRGPMVVRTTRGTLFQSAVAVLPAAVAVLAMMAAAPQPIAAQTPYIPYFGKNQIRYDNF